MTEGQRLASFSRAVRESSLKRFRQVHPNDYGWRPAPDSLSFADILQHLVDADAWILGYLEGRPGPRAVICPGDAREEDWSNLLSRLIESGTSKADRLERMTEGELEREILEPQVLGQTTLWWLVVRGSLDHEIHHRGALQLALRLRYSSPPLSAGRGAGA
jgi:uncharacterized damage-inducible protein DinB